MPDYSTRPGARNESGREAVDRLERDAAAARRDRPRPEGQPTLVQLGLEEVESWPPGTTRLVGDDYPFQVKLTDGTWLTIPPPATPASGGGGALSGGIAATSTLPSFGVELNHGSIPWALHSEPEWDAPPAWLTSDSGSPLLAAGWYMACLELNVGWSAGSAPDVIEVKMANTLGGSAWSSAYESYVPTPNRDGTRKGLRKVINMGHALCPEQTPLMFTMAFYGGSPAAGTLGRQSDAFGPGYATWRIARLGDA